MNPCEHNEECQFPSRTLTPTPLPIPDGGGTGGGGDGEGHKYTFRTTGSGWQVLEDNRVIYSYTDKNDNTTYDWQATDEGWLVKDNTGKVIFNYTDKSGENTTYSFEQTDDCGITVTDNEGKVVFQYKNTCAGTTYTFEQDGVDFKVTNDKTGQVVFNYKGEKNTDTTYTWEDYKDGFKVTDSNGTVVYLYDPELGKRSDGSYPIDTLLTTVFKGHTTISTGQIVGFTPANLVVGETLVYDSVGTVGVITADNGDGTYQVTTMTISPGSRQGVRLGSVDQETDLPKTCADAEAKGWQTPQLGDFAYVIKGNGTADDVISEYVITNVDENCNLTWTFSHSFNAGQYQEQSTTAMSGMILTGGVIPGTFGNPIDPSTLIRGVMRNGILLTPDAQGKVNVIVDDSHVIVNALPTSGIKDNVEYIVIDNNLKVVSTWVHDARGWFQTYEAPAAPVKAHQIVTALPTNNIQENVEYVVVDGTKVVGTWVYDPTKGWLQTEVLDKPAHIVVKELPTTNIDDEAEYVVVGDLTKPVDTFKATYVHTDSGWIKTSEAATSTGGGHIVVTELPTTGILDNTEYIVMTDTSDPSTFTGTWVRVKGNWVQTERVEGGFHIVTALPTANIDGKHTYVLVDDINKPSDTFVSQFAWDDTTKTWVDLAPNIKSVYYNVNREGKELWASEFILTSDFKAGTVGDVVPWVKSSGEFQQDSAGNITIPDGMRVEILVNLPNMVPTSQNPNGSLEGAFFWYDVATNQRVGLGHNPVVNGSQPRSAQSNIYNYGTSRSWLYENNTGAPVTLQFRYAAATVPGVIRALYANVIVKEIGRIVDPVAYLDQNGEAEDTPVGTVQSFLGTKAPENYLLCDGTLYPIGTYPELEAFILQNYTRVNYFGGDGTTTWAVPDLRGEFLRGAGDSGRTFTHEDYLGGVEVSVGQGATVGAHQDPTFMAHNYYYSNSATSSIDVIAWKGNKPNANFNYDTQVQDQLGTTNFSDQSRSRTNTRSNVFGGSTRPTNTSVNYIIKYRKTPVVVAAETVDGDKVAYNMMCPNLWTPGTEQSFGNGVYGMRVKGTINVAANVRAQVTVATGATNLLNCGGQWTRGNKTKIALNSLPLQSAGAPVAPWAAMQLNVDNKVILDINSDIAENRAEYDVWVLYTK